jgi:arsenate reductase
VASYLDGEEVSYVRYLETPLSKEELVALMGLLRILDPRDMARKGEAMYNELKLDEASIDGVLDAMVLHPILLERPIVVKGDRAVIARPPERILELIALSSLS